MPKRSRQVARLAADTAGAKQATIARPRRDTRTVSERRIDEVVELMTSFRWVPGPSHRSLAKAWGVSVSMVEHVAAEASRVVRRLVRADHKEEIAARLATNIELIGARAMARTRRRWRKTAEPDGRVSYVEYVQPDPDFGSALRAQELAAKLLGVLSNDAPSVMVSGGGAVQVGVVILPPEDPPPSVETSGVEVAEPKRLNGGSNGSGNGRG